MLPLNGSREGLFSAIFPALARKTVPGRPPVLIPNPFYQAYAAATAASGAEPVFLPSGGDTGFLPDVDTIDTVLLDRSIAFYLCSPSNPQGAVADADYLTRAIALARRHDFLLFADECYSEIFTDVAPPGALQTAMSASGSRQCRVLPVRSPSDPAFPASDRDSLPGDASFMAPFLRFRNVACPQVPLPIQHVSVAAWGDEVHVEAGRALYRRNFELADRLLAGRYGYKRPAGSFFCGST
ncbi:MAG: aminotransferase class I/II-fold pyridoxal phosphate-dependent enzyme [Methyloceanibacter sp.]|uniref:aminotransferase class I/II-fold pyridoxal phosphate-dependent enzyme n=1 Tax=Methyloceanibacter sp. TaxID=1965321 RepID=UPI003D9B15F6